MSIELIKIAVLIISTTGFWELLKFLYRKIFEKNLANARLLKEKAAASNIYAEAGNRLVQNWIEWSQRLEKRVEELEHVWNENIQLKARIQALEGKIDKQNKTIQALKRQLSKFMTKNGNHAGDE